MSADSNHPDDLPFLESTFEGRPIIDRRGPAVVYIRHVDWAFLVDKGGGEKWRTLVWSQGRLDIKTRSLASIQSNKNGVFVGRHPVGVPLVVVEDWTDQDDVTGVAWG
jgi:hypothetical protein